MPAKRVTGKTTRISDISTAPPDQVPNDEEIAAAAAVLAESSAKAQKSAMASFSSYAKKTDDAEAAQSRGDVRARNCAVYMAWQAKKKGAAKVTRSCAGSSWGRDAHQDEIPMTIAKMKVEFGEKLTQHWLDSKMLRQLEDPVTKEMATDVELQIFSIPVDWTRRSSGQFGKTEGQVETQGLEEDQLPSVADASGVQGDQLRGDLGAAGQVKPEPQPTKTEDELVAEETAKLIADPKLGKQEFTKIMNMITAATAWVAQCKASGYSDKLQADLEKWTPKAKNISTPFERIVAEEKVEDPKALAAILKQRNQLDEEFVKMKGWAVRFGMEQPSPEPVKKRARKGK